MKEHLEAAQNKRLSKYTQHVVKRFPDIHTVTEVVDYGMFSWYFRSSKVRLIRHATMVNCGFGPCTPGDVVRDYLDFHYPRPLRANGRQAEAILSHRSTPLFAHYGASYDAVYVDISAAYWSISNICGWNVDYSPERFLKPGLSTIDFPLPDHKAARACLVSMGVSRYAMQWTGTQFKQVSVRNKHTNFGLWALVQDVLHTIAAKAYELGAFYAHTDGYILPASQSEKLIEYISRWGLLARVKHRGEALVLGVGNFSVGNRTTKRFRPVMHRPVYHINRVNSEWLYANWQHILTRIDHQLRMEYTGLSQ